MITKDSSSVTSDLIYYEEDFSITSIESITFPEQVVKELISVISSNKSSAKISPIKSSMVETSENIDTECQKISYNQKVEQDLRWELSFTEVSNSKINKMFDIQISKFSLKAILMGSSEITAQNIVELFKVAMKLK
ncbi:14590_t:CDS:1, partial [Funneliformis mosseae]